MSRSLVCVCVVLFAPSPVLAHAVGIECKQKQGTNQVSVEVFFDDDAACVGAKVVVKDASKETVAEGKTDAKGFWTFQVKKPGEYLVLADAGEGHLAQKKLTVNDWQSAPGVSHDEAPVLKQTGSSRVEFTRFPWLKVCVGLGAIFIFGIAFLVARRRMGGA